MPNYRHAYDRKEAARFAATELIVNIERYVISVKGQRHRKILSRRFHACAPHMRYMVHTLSGIGLVLRVWSLKDIERLIPPLNVATEGPTRWSQGGHPKDSVYSFQAPALSCLSSCGHARGFLTPYCKTPALQTRQPGTSLLISSSLSLKGSNRASHAAPNA